MTADHASNSPRGLFIKQKITIANSTGTVTLLPTAAGGLNLGVSSWSLNAKSTGIIIGTLAKYINVNSTGIRIGTKYIFTTSVAGGGQ
jgi:hypothetical protein